MRSRTSKVILGLTASVLVACHVPQRSVKEANTSVPQNFSIESAVPDVPVVPLPNWREYFKDALLQQLIDTALQNNQELNILKHEINIAGNEVLSRGGEYRPFARLGAAAGYVHSGKYTMDGIAEEDIKARGDEYKSFIGEQALFANFTWELDIWKKLRNAQEAARQEYLATVEGRNFLKTELVAEIAATYYELIILDNQLAIVNKNIGIQSDAYEMMKSLKEAARINQLAVNRFIAQVSNTRNFSYEIKQMIVEKENHINFLLGRFPQHVERGSYDLDALNMPPAIQTLSSELLANRPDIREAELQLRKANLNVKVARASFFPSFGLNANVGLQSFNPVYILNPKSLAANVLGEITAPLINKAAIQANYQTASEQQIQQVIEYEKKILNAFTEVFNQLNGIQNYSGSFQTKTEQVKYLESSTDISKNLFLNARADYTEVLFTQREALEARMELTEIKMKQLAAVVNLYRALGGGWK